MNRIDHNFIALGLALIVARPVAAIQILDIPGEEVSTSQATGTAPDKTKPVVVPVHANNWLAPKIEEQLSRDRTLIPMGKGAVFIPSYTEPRREPEVLLLDAVGKQVATGQTGERILLDSGDYTVRFGSGTTGQQITVPLRIQEGHTFVPDPQWAGMLVETLTPDGANIDGQYEVIRIEKWTNYGKGHGLKEERLQDTKTWLLPAGLYRISKPGEGFSSLRNYITVQLNPGELHKIEIIFDKIGGDFISGGTKTLTAKAKVDSNWTYGVRAGGNVNLTRETREGGIRKEAMQVSSDARLQVLYDNVRYLGTTEILLQDNFSKDKGQPFSVTSDIAHARTNWVRRLNSWMGPYVRGSVESHLFPRSAERDTIYIIRPHTAPTNPDSIFYDTTLTPGSKDLDVSPILDPMNFQEGLGVNIEFVSRYYLEANTQIGLAGRQNISFDSYVAKNDSLFIRGKSTYEIGVENTFNATMRLGAQATMDLRMVMFAPNANVTNIRLDDLTLDVRTFLSRNLEIGYIYQVKEILEKVKNRYPSSHNLSLRLSFNF